MEQADSSGGAQAGKGEPGERQQIAAQPSDTPLKE
jgi:hypothetical protein